MMWVICQNERKVIVMNELQSLRERIDSEGVKAVVDKLVLLKKSLKVWFFSYVCVYSLSLVFFGYWVLIFWSFTGA